MAIDKKQIQSSALANSKPMGMVGAGRLTSMIWKHGNQQSGWRYRFNLFRTATGGGRVSQLFRPADVIHFVKLAQVLASVIADDGCLSQVERGVLKRLAADLDELWERTSNPASNGACRCRSSDTHESPQTKGNVNGDSTHP
jgi:hypothetical protein